MTNIQPAFTIDAVIQRIFELRGQRVMLDADLAVLYGVSTKDLLQAVTRHLARFENIVFRLSREEWQNLRSQSTISDLSFQNGGQSLWSGWLAAPYAFTKHGALMLSGVLNSSRADEISLLIIRAFVWLRQTIPGHKELAAKMTELENAKLSFKLYSSLLSRQITNNAKLVINRFLK